jgi:predicted TIM-barrel enzyme
MSKLPTVPSSPLIIPVIHYASEEQALRNAKHAADAGCYGVFLIEMNGSNQALRPAATSIKSQLPALKVGINFLGVDPLDALQLNVTAGLDMTWTDEQLTHSQYEPWDEATGIAECLKSCKPHLMFVGVAFKHQAFEPHPKHAANKAVDLGFIPTTSGPATGVPADDHSIAEIRSGLPAKAPLAIASGITPANIAQFSPLVTHILVATGISDTFYEICTQKLGQLMANLNAPLRP